MGRGSDSGSLRSANCVPVFRPRIAIPSPFPNFQRLHLQCERFGVIHVVTAVITAKGACIMTISTTENREPAQATATAAGKPKPPHKARAAAKKGHAAASQARSARKPKSAKKGAQPRRKPGNARPGSKTAKILDLVKRPGGATLKELLKATSWQPHSIRGFLSVLGKKKGVAVESTKSPDGERTYSLKA
jgi:hypothetical protein